MHAAFFRQLTSQLLDCKRSFVGKPQGMSPFPATKESRCKLGAVE
jgi:hypothetical protein